MEGRKQLGKVRIYIAIIVFALIAIGVCVMPVKRSDAVVTVDVRFYRAGTTGTHKVRASRIRLLGEWSGGTFVKYEWECVSGCATPGRQSFIDTGNFGLGLETFYVDNLVPGENVIALYVTDDQEVEYSDTITIERVGVFTSRSHAPGFSTASPPPRYADLAVEVNDAPDPVNEGLPIVWTIDVSNYGQATSNAQLEFTLPSGAIYVSTTGQFDSCSHLSGVVTCRLGDIVPDIQPTISSESDTEFVPDTGETTVEQGRLRTTSKRLTVTANAPTVSADTVVTATAEVSGNIAEESTDIANNTATTATLVKNVIIETGDFSFEAEDTNVCVRSGTVEEVTEEGITYIRLPKNTSNPGGNYITCTVNLGNTGDYYLWGRVRTVTGDSMHVRIDGEGFSDTTPWHYLDAGLGLGKNLVNTFFWDQLNTGASLNTTRRKLTFNSTGNHTFTFTDRDDAELDRIEVFRNNEDKMPPTATLYLNSVTTSPAVCNTDGCEVTVVGENFTPTPTMTFDGVAVTTTMNAGGNTLTGTLPSRSSAGDYTLTVTNPNGTSAVHTITYIAKGDDTPGTVEAPESPSVATPTIVAKDGTGSYTTIQAAVNSATAGTTIEVKSGTYAESVNIGSTSSNCTQALPCTLRAASGAVVNIDPGNGNYQVGDPQNNALTVERSWWLIDGGLAADGKSAGGLIFTHGYHGIEVKSTNVTIRNSKVLKNTHDGIKITSAGDVILDNNTIEQNGTDKEIWSIVTGGGGGGITEPATLYPAITQPLRKVPASSGGRWFMDGNNNPVYLAGFHTWNSLQDFLGYNGGTFNYSAYITGLKNARVNHIRMWQIDEPTFGDGTRCYLDGVSVGWGNIRPFPYLQVSGKWNLDLLNTTTGGFFERLRSRVETARQNGIYVQVMLFDGHWVDNPGLTDPSNSKFECSHYNTINNTHGATNNKETVYTTGSAHYSRQKAYVTKVLETLADKPNVIYEICNECPNDNDEEAWQNAMVAYVKQEEARISGPDHLVGVGAGKHSPDVGCDNAFLTSGPGDWISPCGDVHRASPPQVAATDKIRISDTDHYWASNPLGGSIGWAWKSFTQGSHPILMDFWTNSGPNNGYGNPSNMAEIRRAMGDTHYWSKKINLANMPPNDANVTGSAYVLQNPGQEYLIFKDTLGGTITIASLGAGTYDYQWYNTNTGAIVGGTKSFTLAASGNKLFSLNSTEIPGYNSTNYYALYVKKIGGTTEYGYACTTDGDTDSKLCHGISITEESCSHPHDILIKRNTIQQHGGAALYMSGSADPLTCVEPQVASNIVQNNLFLNNKLHVKLDQRADTNAFSGNTFVTTTYPTDITSSEESAILLIDNSPSNQSAVKAANTFYGNIFYSNKADTEALIDRNNTDELNLMNYNLWKVTAQTWDWQSDDTKTDFNGTYQSTTTYDTNGSINPASVGFITDDLTYHLLSTSPAKELLTDLAKCPAFDVDKDTRPQDALCDAGWDEVLRVVYTADMQAIVDQPPSAQVGVDLAWTAHAKNNGPDRATNVTLSIVYDTEFTYVSHTGTCTHDAPTRTLSCTLPDIISGAIGDITVTLNPTTEGNGTLTATAGADEVDGTPGNDSDNKSVTITAAPTDVVSFEAENTGICTRAGNIIDGTTYVEFGDPASGGEGVLTCSITGVSAGTYYFWGTVQKTNTSSDQVHMRIGAEAESNNTNWRFSHTIPAKTGMHWDQTNYLASGTTPTRREITLTEGANTIVFSHAETGARLDKIVGYKAAPTRMPDTALPEIASTNPTSCAENANCTGVQITGENFTWDGSTVPQVTLEGLAAVGTETINTPTGDVITATLPAIEEGMRSLAVTNPLGQVATWAFEVTHVGGTGNNYYLKAGESGTACTQSSPCGDWNTALGKLNPGDTLWIHDGTWTTQAACGNHAGLASGDSAANKPYVYPCVAVTSQPKIDCSSTGNMKNGTASQPINIRAINERKVFLYSNGLKSALEVDDCSYINVEGLRLAQSNGGGAVMIMSVSNTYYSTFKRMLGTHTCTTSTSCHGFNFGGGSAHNLVLESECLWCGRHAFQFAGSYNTIRRSYAHMRSRHPNNAGSSEGMQTYPSQGFQQFENNIVELTRTLYDVRKFDHYTKFLGNMGTKGRGAMHILNRYLEGSYNNLLKDNVILNNISDPSDQYSTQANWDTELINNSYFEGYDNDITADTGFKNVTQSRVPCAAPALGSDCYPGTVTNATNDAIAAAYCQSYSCGYCGGTSDNQCFTSQTEPKGTWYGRNNLSVGAKYGFAVSTPTNAQFPQYAPSGWEFEYSNAYLNNSGNYMPASKKNAGCTAPNSKGLENCFKNVYEIEPTLMYNKLTGRGCLVYVPGGKGGGPCVDPNGNNGNGSAIACPAGIAAGTGRSSMAFKGKPVTGEDPDDIGANIIYRYESQPGQAPILLDGKGGRRMEKVWCQPGDTRASCKKTGDSAVTVGMFSGCGVQIPNINDDATFPDAACVNAHKRFNVGVNGCPVP